MAPRRALPGRRDDPLLRAVAPGGRDRAEPDGRLAGDPLRPLVEPRRREPGDRPRLPDRAEAERGGPQVRLPRHRGGADRRPDRAEEGAGGGPPGGGRGGPRHRDERRRTSCGSSRSTSAARSPRSEGSASMAWYEWRPYVPVAVRRQHAARDRRPLQEEGRARRARRDPGAHDRPELLGQGLVRQPRARTATSPTGSPAAGPTSATARSWISQLGAGHGHGPRLRQRALPDLHRDRALVQTALAGGGPGVRGEDRLAGGAPAGEVLARGHGDR